ncbi:MAG: hypothetical protein MJA27_21215 [Pseudanabaenales cyanobacterium]|nr:hypothetical protein [Pseudanabaenales cyanobacterium]
MQDPNSLRRLAEIPLFLNIISLAYEGLSAEAIYDLGTHNQRQTLFDTYIRRMFQQRPAIPRYPIRGFGIPPKIRS